ncbi:MAG: hypothetical protein IT379_19050 [Deltaproteobacteria bacterium]|nr:hypothetical protein [Deltaproteobacteria bacterium]
MLYAYIFSLVVGGILLAASILLGGKDPHVEGNLEGHGDADKGGGEHGDAGLLGLFLSLRFWTFFAAFFGLTGVLMRGLAVLPGEIGPLAAAVGMGLVSGLAVQLVVRKIGRSSLNSAIGVDDFVGQSAKVVLPVARGDVGKVRVTVKGQDIDVIATTDDDEKLEAQEEVLVVEMREGTARVARVK